MQMTEKQQSITSSESKGVSELATTTPRHRKASKRAVGVSEWQWRLMLAALGLLALVMVAAIVLAILAALGGLHFA